MKNSPTSFTIPSLENPILKEALRCKIDGKTKPLGSLGRLESMALQIGLIFQSEQPILKDPQMLIFAGDHGLAAQGVSAYPSEVTWQMVMNFLQGGAAISVFARQHQLPLKIVDCGVNHDFPPHPSLLHYKLAKGTCDSSIEPAMSMDLCHQALENGRSIIKSLSGNTLLLGEMGIGNTSAASLLMSRITGITLENCVGAGTGLDSDGVQRKILILEKVLKKHPSADNSLAALACFGGFEIATMIGAILQAAEENRVIVVDRFITTAAVLVAQQLYPNTLQRCIFAHCSQELPHAALLDFLGATPLLKLEMRLGEGSGAAIAWPLILSSTKFLCEMASFESANVSSQKN